jgi:hypothetical protein
VPAGLVFQYKLPDEFLVQPGTRAGFVLLGMFLLSFLFIRTSARLMRSPRVPWWPGSVTTDSGLHLHHLVWGIVLILLAGFLGFALNPVSPWNEILAGLFGVGAGFTLDEFALWVYLRDVYWAQVVLGAAPFNVKGNNSSIASLIIAVSADLLIALTVILKGKPLLGLACVFFPLIAPFGILRLASPTSVWARHFYRADGRSLRRSIARWKRIDARRDRLANTIAGAPTVTAASTKPD